MDTELIEIINDAKELESKIMILSKDKAMDESIILIKALIKELEEE